MFRDAHARSQIQAKSKKSKIAEPKPKSPTPSDSESTSQAAEKPEMAELEPESAHDMPEEKPSQSEETFDSYYLKRVTAEFADDIDKIRNASDFNERSVPVLVQALKQTAANFTEEEKERAMEAKR